MQTARIVKKGDGDLALQQGRTVSGAVVNIQGPVNLSLGNGGAPSQKEPYDEVRRIGGRLGGSEDKPAGPVRTREQPEEETKGTISMSLTEILAAIAAVPPFQRNSVAQHYVGLPIDWRGKFASAKPLEGGKAKVIIYVEDGSPIARPCFCEIELGKYPELKVAKEGAPIRIVGNIGGIFETHCRISDATIAFLSLEPDRKRERDGDGKLDEPGSLSVRVNPTKHQGRQMAQFRLLNTGKRPINIVSWSYGGQAVGHVSWDILPGGPHCTNPTSRLPVLLKEQESCDFLVFVDEIPVEEITHFAVQDAEQRNYPATAQNVQQFIRTARG